MNLEIKDDEIILRKGNKTMIDCNTLIDKLSNEILLNKQKFLKIIYGVTNLFKREPNIIYLEDPLTVVGDIHGQYKDLMTIFLLGGNPENTKYLFLGDYVDRGENAIEIIILLYCLKLNFPNQMFLLRGNHESREITTCNNFRSECLKKYDQEIYDLIMDSFDQMPIAAIINGKYFALHGGISPHAMTCEDISKIKRDKEPPLSGAFCDILWADPVDNESGDLNLIFEYNDSRGCSYYYGYTAIDSFLKGNRLLCLIRAHEAQYDGYRYYTWKNSSFPQIITIFSAPNYCGCYDNEASILLIKNDNLNIVQYNAKPKPFPMLKWDNSFNYSLDMVKSNLIQIWISFLEYTNDNLNQDIEVDDTIMNELEKNDLIKNN